MAERILQHDETDVERLEKMFLIVLSRSPDEKESRLLKDALEQQREHYRTRPDEAAAVMNSGESKPKRIVDDTQGAAWTMLANLVLNLDEAVTRN